MRNEDVSQLLADRRQHEDDVREWRDFERDLIETSHHNPKDLNVFQSDDTITVDLPKFSTRDVKGFFAYTTHTHPTRTNYSLP
jgi:hypothetical protein